MSGAGAPPRVPVLPAAVLVAGVAALTVVAAGHTQGTDLDVVRLGAWLTWPLVGAVVLDARPRSPLGLLLTALGLAPALVVVAAAWSGGDLPVLGDAVAQSPHLVAPGAALLLVGLPLVFPDELPADRWGQRTAAAACGALALAMGTAALRAGAPGSTGRVPGDRLLELAGVLGLLLLVPLAVSAWSRQAVLLRQASGADRARRTWFVVGAAVAVGVVLAAQPLGPAARAYVTAAVVVAAPVCLAGLVLRTQVRGPDGALLRGALLLALTGCLAATYAGAQVLLARTDLPDRSAASGVVTALAALALLPAYTALRDRALVRLYGPARRPASALALLQSSVDAVTGLDSALHAAAGAVAAAVRSPGADVVLRDEVEAAPGAAVLPLTAGDALLGHLVVLPRRPGEAYGRRDLDLLRVLATTVAQVARAAVLAREVERGRGDAVAQRLDERRRLRRDLHDTVGPGLAGLGLRVDAVRRAAPPDVAEQLEAVAAAVRSCRSDVRRLVDGLAPDDAGAPDLETSVRAVVDGWASAAAGTGLVLEVDVPEPLPALPDDVRLAAHRLVGEAVTNVVRHARAGRCTVRLLVHRAGDDAELVVEVHDDGVGVPAQRSGGFGLRSMAERAALVGGDLAVRPVADGHGTAVRARLPLGTAGR